MKKTKIGLPRAIEYHKYGILLKKFFSMLNCQVVVSPETTEGIISLGSSNTNKLHCLPFKIYLGHVIYLSNFCDYVVISNVCNTKECPNLTSRYDYIKEIITKHQLLEYNIHNNKEKTEFITFLKMGLRINKSPIRIIYSYIIAKQAAKKYNIEMENEEKNKLNKKKKKSINSV